MVDNFQGLEGAKGVRGGQGTKGEKVQFFFQCSPFYAFQDSNLTQQSKREIRVTEANDKTFLQMTKPLLHVNHICLPSFISNVTDKKNKLKKLSGLLTSCQKAHLQPISIIFKFSHLFLILHFMCFLYLLFLF